MERCFFCGLLITEQQTDESCKCQRVMTLTVGQHFTINGEPFALSTGGEITQSLSDDELERAIN